MDKLLVDTNIVLDLLAKREAFFLEAQHLFTKADKNEVELYVSALTFANTHYLISKNQSEDDVRKILLKFKILVKVLPLTDKILELALISKFKDFEDAIQYFSAVEHNLDVIITRNKKDFKLSNLPVLNAKEYISKNN